MNKRPALKQIYPHGWSLAPYALLAIAVFIAYVDIYGNEFFFDDEFIIVHNQYLRDWSGIWTIFLHTSMAGGGRSGVLYRPLQNVLYLIVYQLGGLSTIGFHFLNVSLHAADACLLYALGRKLKFNRVAAFFAALIWALHPLQTNAIASMSGTSDPLYVFFCLSGLLTLLPDFSVRRVIVSSGFFILALLSKETAIVFPALAVLCLFLVSGRRKSPKIYLCTWPLWFIAAVYGIAHSVALGTEVYAPNPNDPIYLYTAHFSCRLWTFLASLPTYLRLLVWPRGLHMEHLPVIYTDPWNWKVAGGVLIVLGALTQIIWGKARRGLALSWGMLWWAMAYSPQAGLAFPMHTMIRENWMYLPSAGLFLGTAQSVAGLCAQRNGEMCRRAFAMMGILIAAIFGVLTYEQNKIWQSPFTFYPQVLKYNPVPLMFNNLANAYIERGDYGKARDLLRQSLAKADTIPQTHMNLAYIVLLQSDWRTHADEAISELKRALEIDPDFLPVCEQLAAVYRALGDTKQAAVYEARVQDIQRHQQQ